MNLESRAFEKSSPDFAKLLNAGFVKQGSDYVYERDFMDGDFHMALHISEKGAISGFVTDKETGEEYLPIRVAYQSGSYVSTVRYEYEQILEEIRKNCFLTLPFVSDQANRIAAKVGAAYSDPPLFLWRDDANPQNQDAAVFKCPESDKWYGIIMRTDVANLISDEERARRKQEKERLALERKKERERREKAKKAGLPYQAPKRQKKAQPEPGETVLTDVLNVKIDEAQREHLLTIPGIYSAFHMNHRSWISIRLNDTVPDDTIMELLEISHRFAQGKKTGSVRQAGKPKEWVIPANPKYYDIVTVWDREDDTDWKQGKGIEVGDIVYMYVGAPHSAILYRAVVTKTHIPWEGQGDHVHLTELMEVHVTDRYAKGRYTLKGVMTDFGVTTVRGPRFIPEGLVAYIEDQEKHKQKEDIK